MQINYDLSLKILLLSSALLIMHHDNRKCNDGISVLYLVFLFMIIFLPVYLQCFDTVGRQEEHLACKKCE